MKKLAFLHHCPSFYHERSMLYQRFGQGVSNLSTVAELRTFDGSVQTGAEHKQTWDIPQSRRYQYPLDRRFAEAS